MNRLPSGLLLLMICVVPTLGGPTPVPSPQESPARASSSDPSIPPDERVLIDRLESLRATQPKDQNDEERLQVETLGTLKEHFKRFPDSPRAGGVLQMLARMLEQRGSPDEAERVIDGYQKTHKQAAEALAAMGLLFDLYTSTERAGKAVEAARSFLASYPDYPPAAEVTSQLADFFADNGKPDEAAQLITGYLKTHPHSPRARALTIQEASFEVLAGRPSVAISTLEALQKEQLAPEDLERCSLRLGQALLARSRQVPAREAATLRGNALDRFKSMIAAIRKSPAKATPTGLQAYLSASDVALASGDKAGAVHYLEEMAQFYKGSPDAAYIEDLLKNTRMIGSLAPEFRALDLDEKPISLKDLAGRIVLLDFWATWCGPCMAELPNILRLFQDMKGHPFAILSVSLDRPEKREDLKRFVTAKGMAWHQIMDNPDSAGSIAKLYHVIGIPATFLLDEKGVVVRAGIRGNRLQDAVADEVGRLEAARSENPLARPQR